jgi:hypothetical protein
VNGWSLRQTRGDKTAEDEQQRQKKFLHRRQSVWAKSECTGGSNSGGYYSVSVSVALLLARSESVTPLGALTVAVSERVPVANELIFPVAL